MWGSIAADRYSLNINGVYDTVDGAENVPQPRSVREGRLGPLVEYRLQGIVCANRDPRKAGDHEAFFAHR